MKINKKMVYIPVLCVFVFALIFTIYKMTYSIQYSYAFDRVKNISINRENLQKLISKTAYAFYYNSEFIQYDSSYMSINGDNEFMYRNLAVTPEDINKNNNVYMDNVSFIYSVYLNSIYLNLSDNASLVTGIGLTAEDIYNDDYVVVNGNLEEHSTSSQQETFIKYFLDMLEVGDIVAYTNNDNLMFFAIYAGNGKCIYADGSNDYEEKMSIYLDDIDSLLFSSNTFKEGITSYSILRPINKYSFSNGEIVTKLPINSLVRLDDVVVRRYTNVSEGDVYRGEEISYVIEIENNSLRDINIKKITDVVDSRFELLAITDGNYKSKNYNSLDRTITWNDVSVAAGSDVKLAYSVKVLGISDDGISDDSIYGNEIVSDRAKVYFDNSGNYMELNSINLSIYNKYIDYQYDSIKDGVADLNDTSKFEYSIDNEFLDDYKLTDASLIHLNKYSFINYIYYNYLGVDNILINDDIILNDLFKYDENGYYVFNDLEYAEISKMIPNNLYGGFKLFDNNRNKVISSVVDGKFNYNKFVIGDIIVLFDSDNNSNVYLYVGEGDFVSYSEDGLNTLEDIIFDDGSLYVVFRPSRVNDISINKVEVSDIFLSFNDSKKIDFQIYPVNATIKSINFSESEKFSIDGITIEGKNAGTDDLNIIFNDDYNVNIKVTVLKEVYKFSIDSPYLISDDDQIMYVLDTVNVADILNNITLSDNNIEKNIYDSEGNILNDTLVDNSYLKFMSNSELIKQYRIVYISFDSDDFIIDEENKIIKYVSIDTIGTTLINMFSVHGASALVKITTNELVNKNNDDVLCSGDKLIINITDDLSCEYQISVLFDTTGNGVFSPNDVVYASRHIVEWVNPSTNAVFSLEPVYELAADVSKNGIVSPNDVTIMRRKLVDN